MIKQIPVFVFTLLLGIMILAQDEGIFVDKRDGQEYPTIKINDKTWLARNFNYPIKNSWDYPDRPENDKKYGRLYTWKAALKACPHGWHLPTDKEWKELEEQIGIPGHQLDEIDYRTPENVEGFERFKKVFNLVMSGCRKHDTGQFLGKDSFAFFWTSSPYKKIYAWKRAFDKVEKGIGRHTFNRKNAASVRYIKNSD